MSRLEKLQSRRTDPGVVQAKLANEVYRSLQQSDGVRYAIGAMQPIDPDYTAKTFEQGNRIQRSLSTDQGVQRCDFKFQGSTTNDTHIRAVSDIDLVIITKKFTWLRQPLQPAIPYAGDTVFEMKSLREQCVTSVRSSFPAVTIDDSGGKAVKLSGGSLARNVDLVPAAWLDTEDYHRYGEEYRGIEIIDYNTGDKISNFPWIHNLRIEEKDSRCMGGLRRAARLMKSLKADSDRRELPSSYDIVSIAYNMPDALLRFPPPYELTILESCRSYCRHLLEDNISRVTILVPNETRKVFTDGGATIEQLIGLTQELEQLISEIARDVARPLSKLAEARVEHPIVSTRTPNFGLVGR